LNIFVTDMMTGVSTILLRVISTVSLGVLIYQKIFFCQEEIFCEEEKRKKNKVTAAWQRSSHLSLELFF
jgi:hypothetical protein